MVTAKYISLRCLGIVTKFKIVTIRTMGGYAIHWPKVVRKQAKTAITLWIIARIPSINSYAYEPNSARFAFGNSNTKNGLGDEKLGSFYINQGNKKQAKTAITLWIIARIPSMTCLCKFI